MKPHSRIKSLLGIFLVATTGLAIHAATTSHGNISAYRKNALKYAQEFIDAAKSNDDTKVEALNFPLQASAKLTFFNLNSAVEEKKIADLVIAARNARKASSADKTKLKAKFNELVNAIFVDAQMPKGLSTKYPKDAKDLHKYVAKVKATTPPLPPRGGTTKTKAEAQTALQDLADELESTIGFSHKELVHTISFLTSFETNGANVNGTVTSSDPTNPWILAPQAKIDAMVNVAKSAAHDALKAQAGTLATNLETASSSTDFDAVYKSAANINGQLFTEVQAFIRAFNKAAAGSKKAAKTVAELKKDYTGQLEAAVPATYSFASIGGGLLSAGTIDDTWLKAPAGKQIINANKAAAITAVEAAKTARQDALELINSISNVDATGKMTTAANTEIADKEIKDAIRQAKDELGKAFTAVKAAFEDASKGDDKTDVLADATAFWKDFATNLALITSDATATKALENLFVNPDNIGQQFISYNSATDTVTPDSDLYNTIDEKYLDQIEQLKEAIKSKVTKTTAGRIDIAFAVL